MGRDDSQQVLYLDSAKFNERFDELFASLTSRFWKIEHLQDYSEPDTEAIVELRNGRWTKAVSLIHDLGKELATSNNSGELASVNFRRLRRVELPLTPYTRLELELYSELVAGGNEVSLLVADELEFGFSRDVMIFDDRAMLVHDHIAPGVSVGGWLVADPDQVAEATALFAQKFDAGLPPDEFRHRYVDTMKPGWKT